VTVTLFTSSILNKINFNCDIFKNLNICRNNYTVSIKNITTKKGEDRLRSSCRLKEIIEIRMLKMHDSGLNSKLEKILLIVQ
jgi:hypothetical protein